MGYLNRSLRSWVLISKVNSNGLLGTKSIDKFPNGLSTGFSPCADFGYWDRGRWILAGTILGMANRSLGHAAIVVSSVVAPPRSIRECRDIIGGDGCWWAVASCLLPFLSR